MRERWHEGSQRTPDVWQTDRMRTTLELDENVLRAAERCASEQGLPLVALIEAAVRRYLEHVAQLQPAADAVAQSDDAGDTFDALVARTRGSGRAAVEAMVAGAESRPRPKTAKGLSYAGSIDDDPDLSLKVEEILAAPWPKG